MNSIGSDYTNNADGWEMSGGTTKRKLKITGADVTLTGSGSATYTFPASTDTLVGRASTDTLTNKTVTGLLLTAGSATVPPITWAAGTNKTTPAAGEQEFDGTIWTLTPDATRKRALNYMCHVYVNNAAVTMPNSATATNIMTTGSVALKNATTYEFELVFSHTQAATTSHTESFLFNIAGGGSVTAIAYLVTKIVATTTATGVQSVWSTVATATAITPAIVTVINGTFIIKGIIRVNAAGTFAPQFKYSAGPGGTGSILAGAYFKIWPLGAAGADINIGTWA